MGKKKPTITIYQVRIAFDKPVTGFHYPPQEPYTPEENEIQFCPLGYAIIGGEHPFEWYSRSAAQFVANTIGGYVESHEVEESYLLHRTMRP
jgi:hypothetical protein